MARLKPTLIREERDRDREERERVFDGGLIMMMMEVYMN